MTVSSLICVKIFAWYVAFVSLVLHFLTDEYFLLRFPLRCGKRWAGGSSLCRLLFTACCTCTRDSRGPRRRRSELWSGSLWITQPRSCSSSWASQVLTAVTRSSSKFPHGFGFSGHDAFQSACNNSLSPRFGSNLDYHHFCFNIKVLFQFEMGFCKLQKKKKHVEKSIYLIRL